MADFLTYVNGREYSWTDISVVIAGVPMAGITSITYSETQASEKVYGAGKRPVSFSLGKIEAECEIEISRVELNGLLAASVGNSLLDIGTFDIIVAYANSEAIPVVDIVKNCRFTSQNSGGSLDDASLSSTLTVMCSHVNFGVTLP